MISFKKFFLFSFILAFSPIAAWEDKYDDRGCIEGVVTPRNDAFLETKRLEGRPFIPSDWLLLYNHLFSKGEMMKYWDDGKIKSMNYTEGRAKKFVSIFDKEAFGWWMFFEKGTKKFICTIGSYHDKDNNKVEFCYFTAQEHQKQGFLKEAMLKFLDYLHKSHVTFDSLWATAHPDNEASVAFLKKLIHHEVELLLYPNLRYKFEIKKEDIGAIVRRYRD